METILWQLTQADEFFANYALKDTLQHLKPERTHLYQQVLHINQVSKEQFKKSFDYYMRHPSISRPMFDSIAAKANRQRTDIYTKPYKIEHERKKK
jgi:hypothetical protein